MLTGVAFRIFPKVTLTPTVTRMRVHSPSSKFPKSSIGLLEAHRYGLEISGSQRISRFPQLAIVLPTGCRVRLVFPPQSRSLHLPKACSRHNAMRVKFWGSKHAPVTVCCAFRRECSWRVWASFLWVVFFTFRSTL